MYMQCIVPGAPPLLCRVAYTRTHSLYDLEVLVLQENKSIQDKPIETKHFCSIVFKSHMHGIRLHVVYA